MAISANDQRIYNKKNLGLRHYLRLLLMPGFDLFTRRRVKLKQYWRSGERRFLDAGSGNGWFSYLAYRSGATVTAVNFEYAQVEKARNFYNNLLQVPTEKLKFCHLNLYEVETLNLKFDEIICYETLEHILGDQQICQSFFRMLNPGGVLHLCCPYAEHPRWQAEELDLKEEWGGHVRTGYTPDSYRALLEPIGFQISKMEGVGGKWLAKAQLLLFAVRNRFGDLIASPLAFCLIPLVWFDRHTSVSPYCLYVRAVKPAQTDLA